MARNQDVFFPLSINTGGVTFVNADGATDVTGSTNTKTLVTGAANDTVCRNICITSDDTAAKDVMVFLSNGSTNYLLGIIPVAITSGFATGIPSVNLLDRTYLRNIPVDKDGNPYILVKNGWFLKTGMKAAMTAAKTLTITHISEDY